jgi:hypothetical protein
MVGREHMIGRSNEPDSKPEDKKQVDGKIKKASRKNKHLKVSTIPQLRVIPEEIDQQVVRPG